MATRFHTPGSFWIELLLWILFFPAGIVYSLWRWTSRKPVVTEKINGSTVYRIYDGSQPLNPKDRDIWMDYKNRTMYVFMKDSWVTMPGFPQ